jgi:hypothetical protein
MLPAASLADPTCLYAAASAPTPQVVAPKRAALAEAEATFSSVQARAGRGREGVVREVWQGRGRARGCTHAPRAGFRVLGF